MIREKNPITFEISGHVYKLGDIVDHKTLGKLTLIKIYRSRNVEPWHHPYLILRDSNGVEHKFLPGVLLDYIKY